MEKRNYDKLLEYLRHGIEPVIFNSTRGNFLSTSRKYRVNANGFLTRNGKVVVTIGEMEKKIFAEFHQCSHSGRSSTWRKINKR